ncbi:MAG: DUF2608 domain-containing protein [Chlamydiales bacterium]|nr:DUF2608 domain-containing protein [Chlamydiales bacterium]
MATFFARIGLCMMLAFSAVSQAEIIQVDDIKVLHQYATPDTLILTDIDHTLLQSATQLASHEWWVHLRKAVDQSALTRDQAWPVFGPQNSWIFHQVPVRPMQEDTAQVIKQLQEKKQPLLALTARPKTAIYCPHYDRLTRDHLKKIDIDFTLSTLPAELGFTEIETPLWSSCYGVIFTGKIPKGTSLVAFLKDHNFKPSRVVLIDDMLYQLESMENALAELGIEFVGLHYVQEPKPFDAAIANVQWHALMTTGVVPSDEEAAKIKEKFPERDPNFMLNYVLDSVRFLHL